MVPAATVCVRVAMAMGRMTMVPMVMRRTGNHFPPALRRSSGLFCYTDAVLCYSTSIHTRRRAISWR